MQVLSLAVQGLTEGQTQVSPTDSIIVSASAPLDPATVNTTNITLVETVGNVPVPIKVMAINMNSGIQISPVTPPLKSNTMYTLKLSLGIHDAFGQSAAAATTLHFTTGT